MAGNQIIFGEKDVATHTVTLPYSLAQWHLFGVVAVAWDAVPKQ